MSDIENELRELLDEDAARAPLPGLPPRPLLRRTRRRQAVLVAASAVMVAAVGVGSIAGLQALLGKPAKIVPAQGPERTTTLVGVTITTPQSWALADLWPLSLGIATSSQLGAGAGTNGQVDQTGPTPIAVPTPTPIAVPTGLPIFQVSNYDAGLVPACGAGTAVASDGTFLYVALDVDQMQGVTRGPRPQDWPVALGDTPTDGPCGSGLYARWQTRDIPYFAFAAFGSDVSATDRDELLGAFDGMSMTSVRLVDAGHPGLSGPGYVVASGVAGPDPWNLLVSPSSDGGGVPVISLEVAGSSSDWQVGNMTDIVVPDPKDLQAEEHIQGDTLFEWGAVSRTADQVEVRLDGGETFPGEIAAIPPSMGADFSAFVVAMPNTTSGTVVALDANGGEIASQDFVWDTSPGGVCLAMEPPAPTDKPPGDTWNTMEAEAALRNALAAAKTFYADCGSYSGFGPDIAVAIEPALAYNTSSTATPGVISIRDVSTTTVLLVTATADGRPFCIADDTAAGLTTYGTVDAQAVAECSNPSWP
jgi:hypothetical protein